MDITIAVPSPHHADTTSTTPLLGVSTSTGPHRPSPSYGGDAANHLITDTGQTQTLVHARLDARDVNHQPTSPEATACTSPPNSPQQRLATTTESPSDVERFDGKIVYNPDGSAYIIEESSDGNGSDGEDERLLQEGAIVDGRRTSATDLQSLPQIASAFYVSRHATQLYNALYGAASTSAASAKAKSGGGAPVMHSYRVYSPRHQSGPKASPPPLESAHSGADCSSVPIKPILMCFVCKLSFGFAKSFVSHALSDHPQVVLDEREKEILQQSNTSAILQLVGKSKVPVVSFLEPVSSSASSARDAHQADSQDADADADADSDRALHRMNQMNQLNQLNHLNQLNQLNQMNQRRPSEHSSPLTQSQSEAEPSHDTSYDTKELDQVTTMHSPQVMHSAGNGRTSLSPMATSLSSTPSPVASVSPLGLGSVNSHLTGTPTGVLGAMAPVLVCPEHPNGRPMGCECPRCDLAAANSRGPLALMATRNSCKTLKCPKCNWHYKYQETLEIHMKEKHPENETSCLYCLTSQAHPRLARGETYTCGYKPYRCEVCNYSTTTKGNLSIHMQSDKHLNNAQELQNGGLVLNNGESSANKSVLSALSGSTPPGGSPVAGGAGAHATHAAQNAAQQLQSGAKPKPTWRCDVCNYETNVARNLRIHMTSEKHTHNMIMLQQNVKRMQQLSVLQASSAAGSPYDAATAAALFHQEQAKAGGTNAANQLPEAALADMAYNQALFIQMMTGGQLPQAGQTPAQSLSDQSLSNNAVWHGVSGGGDVGLNPETMEPPPEPVEANPCHAFQCLVCSVYGSNSAEALAAHVAADRSRQREHEALLMIGGHYMCRLCAYKTTLKANFQLHCKTDKHLQRLQHATHIQEGGSRNDWKLQYVTSTANPVQLRCNACEYYTNSVHKMQVHAASGRHEVAAALFRHLSACGASASGLPVVYQCRLCQVDCTGKMMMLQHARSLRHCQMEQLAELQRRAAAHGKDVPPLDIRDVFGVVAEDQDAVDDADAPANADLHNGTGTFPSYCSSDQLTLSMTCYPLPLPPPTLA